MVPMHAWYPAGLWGSSSVGSLAKKTSLLLIATDNDREGESIGQEIVDECRRVNKRLKVKRMKFTAITEREVPIPAAVVMFCRWLVSVLVLLSLLCCRCCFCWWCCCVVVLL